MAGLSLILSVGRRVSRGDHDIRHRVVSFFLRGGESVFAGTEGKEG